MITAMSNNSCEPLLKWAGGKRRIVSQMLPWLPSKFARYYEPFLGGGALFFSLAPKQAVLSDTNADLINAYEQVRDNLDNLIKQLSRLPNTASDYYRVRSSKPRTEVGRAARLIYLCTLSFNGIYRQNLKGEFNVPYGYKTHLFPCDEQRLRLVSERLQNQRLIVSDFEDSVETARRGDLVYFDPPYTVAHGNNGFIKYNAKIFSWQDQVRLASLARQVKASGVYVVISNAKHKSIENLYKGFRAHTICRPSVMAASAKFRGPVEECLFL